jgi:hypothetical protein
MSTRLDPEQGEQITEQELLTALWKAPRGCAPGVDGWRFEHLWDCLRVTSAAVDPATVRLTDALLALEEPGSARQVACVELRPDGRS